MNAAAISILLLSGICSEPCAGDCGACCNPHISIHESFHKFFCGIGKPCNAHENDWPLEYPPFQGGSTGYYSGPDYNIPGSISHVHNNPNYVPPNGPGYFFHRTGCGCEGGNYDYRREFGYPWNNGSAQPPMMMPAGAVIDGESYEGQPQVMPQLPAKPIAPAQPVLHSQLQKQVQMQQRAVAESQIQLQMQQQALTESQMQLQQQTLAESQHETPRLATPTHLPSVLSRKKVTDITRRPAAMPVDATADETLEATRPDGEPRR